MGSIERGLGSCVVFVLALGSAGCAAERPTYAPSSPPTAPAYWESALPDPPPRTKTTEPTTVTEVPGAGSDPEAKPRPVDHYLWEDGVLTPEEPSTPPDSQIPLRSETDGGAP